MRISRMSTLFVPTFILTVIGLFGLAVQTAEATEPTVTLEHNIFTMGGSFDHQGWVDSTTATIHRNNEIYLRWSSTDADSCTNAGSGFDNDDNEVSGTDYFVTKPSANNTKTYSVTCVGSGGTTTSSLAVTYVAPEATLEWSIDGGVTWSASTSKHISPDDEVQLRWSSTNADSCVAGSIGYRYNPYVQFQVDGGFETGTGSPTSGTDNDTNEPIIDRDTKYTVTCSDSHTASDSARVTMITRALPEIDMEQKVTRWEGWTYFPAEWSTSSSVTIYDGEEVRLQWDLKMWYWPPTTAPPQVTVLVSSPLRVLT